MNDFETVVERHPPALPGAADHAASPAATQGGLAAGPQTPAGPQFPGPAGQTELRGPVVLGKGIEPRSSARTWTVELPAGIGRDLNANRRQHHMERNRLTQEMKDAAIWCTRAAKVPHLARAHIVAEYRPPDRRRRDVHNLYPAVKAAVDGVVAAGVLTDDSDAYLVGPDMRVSDRTCYGGRFRLHITELGGDDE